MPKSLHPGMTLKDFELMLKWASAAGDDAGFCRRMWYGAAAYGPMTCGAIRGLIALFGIVPEDADPEENEL